MTRRSSVILNIVLASAAVLAIAAVIHDQAAPRDAPPEVSVSKAQATLPMVTIRVGGVGLRVEVADEPREQRMGYMYRDSPDGTGMLFVFPDERMHSFWMRNTPFDIDLAYIRSDGTISETVLMKAWDERSRESREPAQYVLEVPAPWFADNGVVAGTRVTIPPEVRPPPEGTEGRR
jgi:uncharacterized protein